MKAIQVELRKVTARFHSGGIEAGGRITEGHRTRLHNRFDSLILELRNKTRPVNIP